MARFDESDAAPRIVANCEYCREEIYVGDEVMRIDDGGGFVHSGFIRECANEFAKERVYDREGVIGENAEIE